MKRYSLEYQSWCHSDAMVEDENGDYVLYVDYLSTQAKVEIYETKLNRIGRLVAGAHDAGDALLGIADLLGIDLAGIGRASPEGHLVSRISRRPVDSQKSFTHLNEKPSTDPPGSLQRKAYPEQDLAATVEVVDGALPFKPRLAHFGDMAYVKGASLDAHPGLQAGMRVYVRACSSDGRTAFVFDETDGEYVVDTTDLEILSSHFFTLETPPEPYQPTGDPS